VMDIPYCAQSPLPYQGNKFNCVPDGSIEGSRIYQGEIALITHHHKHLQVRKCSNTTGVCTPWRVSSDTDYFYNLNFNNFTLLVDHTLFLQTANTGTDSRNLKGWVYSPNSELCLSKGVDLSNKPLKTAPCYFHPLNNSQNLDYFYVDTLLDASGAQNLDSPSA
jgi:hypothetical protein